MKGLGLANADAQLTIMLGGRLSKEYVADQHLPWTSHDDE